MVSYERGVEAHEGKTILFQHLNLFIHITYAYSDGAAICTAMFLIFRWLDTLTVPHWAGYSLLDGSRCSPKKEETSFFFFFCGGALNTYKLPSNGVIYTHGWFEH